MRTLTALLSLLICLSVNAQVAQTAMPRDVTNKKIIDSAMLSITYRVKIATDTISEDGYLDTHILDIGRQYRHNYSALAQDIDSAKYKVKHGLLSSRDGLFSRTMTLAKNEDGTYEDIITNFPNRDVNMVYTRFLNQTYVYQEPIPNFKWEISNVKDSILGYECIEAKTFFRGRNYIVWFTLDIPISAGPWKLSGLPGLILKAKDSNSLFHYTAIGVEQQQNKPMYIYEQKAIKCNRNDILRLNDLRWANFDLLVQAVSGQKVINVGSDSNITSAQEHAPNYIPQIELE